jgi:hypothetical protein
MNPRRCQISEWEGAPQIDMGAPMPGIVACGRELFVAYIVADSAPVSEFEALYAVVRFGGVLQHTFGYPGEDGFILHPLFSIGLGGRAFNEVRDSPYVRELGSRYKFFHPAYLNKLTHWIVGFHDETLEVIGDTVEFIRTVGAASAAEAISKVTEVDGA